MRHKLVYMNVVHAAIMQTAPLIDPLYCLYVVMGFKTSVSVVVSPHPLPKTFGFALTLRKCSFIFFRVSFWHLIFSLKCGIIII